jgi:hypothetical protein
MFTIKNTDGLWYQGEIKKRWGPEKTRAKYDAAHSLPGSIPESQDYGRLVPTLTIMVRGDILQYENLENPGALVAGVFCED